MGDTDTSELKSNMKDFKTLSKQPIKIPIISFHAADVASSAKSTISFAETIRWQVLFLKYKFRETKNESQLSEDSYVAFLAEDSRCRLKRKIHYPFKWIQLIE